MHQIKNRYSFALAASLTLFSFSGYAKNFDEGMFLKWQIPYDVINRKYGADLTPEKVEKLLRGAVRVSVGGSGTFVSSTGLVYTNHHIANDCVNSLRGLGMIPMKGYYDAKDYSQELRCPDYAIHTTEGIWDVTKAVEKAADKDAAFVQLQNECESGDADIECRLTRVGGREDARRLPDLATGTSNTYLLEKLRIHRDVRLVYAPSEERGFLGGATFNFQFPRYDLDFSFLRVYDEKTGGPLDTSKIFLRANLDSKLNEGDFMMIVGHPGSTARLLSSWGLSFQEYQYLALRRDRMASIMKALEAEIELLRSKTDASSKMRLKSLQSDYFSYANNFQRFQGMIDGLRQTKLAEERQQDELKIRAALSAGTVDELTRDAGIALLEGLASEYSALAAIYPDYFQSGGVKNAQEVSERMVTIRNLNTGYLDLRAKYLGKVAHYFDANFSQRFSYGAIVGIHEEARDDVDWATYYSDLNKHVAQQPKLNGRPVSELLEEDKVEFLRREGDKSDTKGMVLDFITDNDTTGGNSGSGVYNKDLEVVGALFDGNWRGLVSDFDFDVDPASRSVVVSMQACVHYMKNGNPEHRIYRELLRPTLD